MKRLPKSSKTPSRRSGIFISAAYKKLVRLIVLSESHRIIKKNFESELWVDGKQLPLNHMMQETIGNILTGFSKTLKGAEEPPEKIEVKIKRLHQSVDVDAHTYP